MNVRYVQRNITTAFTDVYILLYLGPDLFQLDPLISILAANPN